MPLQRGEEIVHANGVDLCVETFGDPADPAILLIMGAGALDGLVGGRVLRAARGRFALRRPLRPPRHRPLGHLRAGRAAVHRRATWSPDAVGVLDALRPGDAPTSSACRWAAAIAQQIALDHPDRVESLTLISTSPVVQSDPELPPMSERQPASGSSRRRSRTGPTARP